MKKLLALLLVALLLVPLAALADVPSIEFSEYTHPDDGYKAVYPAGWDVINADELTMFMPEDDAVFFIVMHTPLGISLDAPDLKEMMEEENLIGILVEEAGIEEYESQIDGQLIVISDIAYVIYGGVGDVDGDRASIFVASTGATGTLYVITFVANMTKTVNEDLSSILAQTVLDAFVPGPVR